MDQLGEIIDLAADLGFKSQSISDVMPNDDVAASLALTTEEFGMLNLPELVERGARRGVSVSFNLRRESRTAKTALRCFQPWEYAMVSAEGDVLPCCAIVGSAKASVMGNVFQQSFKEIWNGDAFKDFRRRAADGTNDLCNKCPYY
jgi:radical SAM protein with 4Fe4S-binding SPASM domain